MEGRVARALTNIAHNKTRLAIVQLANEIVQGNSWDLTIAALCILLACAFLLSSLLTSLGSGVFNSSKERPDAGIYA